MNNQKKFQKKKDREREVAKKLLKRRLELREENKKEDAKQRLELQFRDKQIPYKRNVNDENILRKLNHNMDILKELEKEMDNENKEELKANYEKMVKNVEI